MDLFGAGGADDRGGDLTASQDSGEGGVSVPRDVSVVGFDDVPFAADLTPALTTVRVPFEELGRTAVRLALEREVGFTSDNHVVLSTQLVIRDSVRPVG